MSTPKFPRTDSLTGRALMRLMVGRKFTHRDFQNETGSYRLSSHIEQLRNRHGWPIETIDETAPTKDPIGRNATYARYFIPLDFLRSARAENGERFEKFIGAVKKFEKEGKGGGMTQQGETATGCDQVAANIKQSHRYFIETFKRVRVDSIRLCVWLRMAWG